MTCKRVQAEGNKSLWAVLALTDRSLSVHPEIIKVPDDQADDLQTLTFDDLLNFAFQVAKGMEFLSSKNVRNQWTTLWNNFIYELIQISELSKYTDDWCCLSAVYPPGPGSS